MPNQFDEKDLGKIMNEASKAGIGKADIDAVKQGNLDSVMKKLKPDDAKKLREVLGNKEMQEKLLNSPQAQALIRNFLNKK